MNITNFLFLLLNIIYLSGETQAKEIEQLKTFYSFFMILLQSLSFFYGMMKFYRGLCYTKITFDWFPLIDPNWWPLAIINSLTSPYFAFWEFLIPTLRFQKSSLNISGIIALEMLSTILSYFVFFGNLISLEITQIEAKLSFLNVTLSSFFSI
jgi:hypothetical protein